MIDRLRWWLSGVLSLWAWRLIPQPKRGNLAILYKGDWVDFQEQLGNEERGVR